MTRLDQLAQAIRLEEATPHQLERLPIFNRPRQLDLGVLYFMFLKNIFIN